jgi:putative SOS response-associated peptidase YedK
MALAGLWESWRSPAGERVRSFAIITTTPNEICARLHNRMPVVLKPEAWPIWRGSRGRLRTQDPVGAVSLGADDLLAGQQPRRKRQEQRS